MLSRYATSNDKKYHLYFVIAKREKGDKRKLPLYIVRKDGTSALAEYLGEVRFDGAWRQFVFYPATETKWSYGCLEIVNKFLKDKTKKMAKENTKEKIICEVCKKKGRNSKIHRVCYGFHTR